MNTCTRRIVASAAILLIACSRSGAMTQPEGTYWASYHTNAIPPGGSEFGVRFIARVTALDIASGVTFSIQERDPGGNNLLFDLALPWPAPYPAIGTEMRVGANFYFACDAGNLVAVRASLWWVSWCDPQLGTQNRYGNQGTVLATGGSEPEDFEFVLVDENGIEAPGATAEDAYYCGSSAVTAAERSHFPSPYELLQQGLSIASESPFLPRSDPELQAEYSGQIQLAFDPMGQQICGEIPPGTVSTLYVVARAAGPTLCGITGAELRVVGMPANWFAAAAIPANSISVGDPLSSAGGNVAYTSCQSPAAGPVLLYTISIFATTAVTDHVVEITARTPPFNSQFNCPLVTLCDMPMYTIVCMEGSRAYINPRAGAICEVPVVGVESHTWSSVKDLYRDANR